MKRIFKTVDVGITEQYPHNIKEFLVRDFIDRNEYIVIEGVEIIQINEKLFGVRANISYSEYDKNLIEPYNYTLETQFEKSLLNYEVGL